LEGTAVVRVVDVDPPSTVQSGKAAKAQEVKEVQTSVQPQPQPAGSNFCASARETGLCVLEESMRALTLGKK